MLSEVITRRHVATLGGEVVAEKIDHCACGVIDSHPNGSKIFQETANIHAAEDLRSDTG